MEDVKPTYAELEQKVRDLEAAAACRKLAEGALRAGEARLIDNLKQRYFFFSYTPSGQLISVSPSVHTVLGYSQEEFLANFYSLLTDNPCNSFEVVSAPDPSLAHDTATDQSVSEIEIFHRDGSVHWLEVIDIPLYDETGQVVAVECIANDITARKQAELSLWEEKNKLEAVFATIGEGLSIMDGDFRILYQNQIHEEQFGKHLNELCFHVSHNLQERCPDCPLAECFQDGKVHKREMTVSDSRGVQYLEISAGPIRDMNGKIVAGFEIVRNITDYKQLVSQVIQAQKIESTVRLAEGVAHEFNNILTGIMNYAELAREQALPSTPLEKDISEIINLSKRMSDLTRQLLAFSRQEPLNTVLLNLNHFIKELEPLLNTIVGDKIKIVLNFSPDIGMIHGDPIQLEQVMTRMIVNASHAMPDGGQCVIMTENVEVGKSDTPAQNKGVAPGRYVRISISDTGAGMGSQTMERIFDPFFTTSGIGSGSTGLGLSSVHGKVKKHGGDIKVFSHVGHGTLFEVYLPRVMGTD